jgi:two-component system response regulator VicR
MKTPSAMRILIIEDETILRTAVADYLQAAGYDVLTAADGEAGLFMALTQSPDLVVLDVMMPKRDGISVCQEMRRRKLTTPVIMLTAKGLIKDRIAGLDSGADDYVVKPFSLGELAARIRAMLRRSQNDNGEPIASILNFGGVEVDLSTRVVKKDGKTVPLSAKEYGVLKLLVEAGGNPVSRDEFLQIVWGYAPFIATRTVDNHIARLRAKLELDSENPQYILTLPKAGYRLAVG